MSDPRAGRMRTTSGTNRDAQRRILDSTPSNVQPGDTHEFGLKPANPGPSSYESAKRGVKSTRTPADWVHDSDPPLRSQTVPLPASSSKKSNVEPRNRRAPTSNPTIPIPTTRQRTRSGPRSRPSNTLEGPKMPEPRNELAGTGYIVEPLAESYSQEYYDDTTLLAPPRMPIPDARQSTSSFQTEPSSYYTVDENWSTGGPAPQMPDHTVTQKKDTYEDLWLAAQSPEMPAPNSTGLPMPSPYEKDEDIGGRFPHDVHADEHDDEWRPTGPYRMPEQNPHPQPEHNPQPQPEHKDTTSSPAPLDRYDSSWLARPSPGMPAPKTASPLMPSPSTAPSEQNKTQPSYASGPLKTGTSNIPSTAPLRVHHRIRPPSLTQASVATSPFGRVPVSQSRPDSHRVEYNTPAGVGGAPLPKPPTEPTPSTSQHDSGEQRLPAATTTYTQQKPPSSQSFSSEPRPTDSAPIVSPSQKPYVPVYGNLQNIGSAKPPQSTSPLGGRVETRPTASTPIAPSTTPHKVTSVHTQHTRPITIPPAPTVSPPNAPTKPTIPPAPTAPTKDSNTPHLQQHASASASKEKEKEKQQQHEHASVATTAAALKRPHRGEFSQLDTQYVNMLLALDDIPSLHNIFAGFFNWILLAGFILFPGTFTSLQNLSVTNGQIEQQLLHAVTHLPLFIVAWVCCGFGAIGLIWLWWRWRKNYLWGLNKIFLPGLMNSLAGLISTITNIFGVQHGQLSTTSKSTVVVVTASTAIFAFLTLFYMFWLVRRVKARHDREVGKQRAGKFGEGVVDISTRKI